MKRKVVASVLIGMAAMFGITAQAQVYSDVDTVKAVQEKLNEAGYSCGTADGIAGEKTYEAVLAYQNAKELSPSGEIDDALLESLGLSESETEAASEEFYTETAPEEIEFSEETESWAETESFSGMDGMDTGNTEATPQPVENITIDGTLLYNDNYVAVTASLSEDGKAVEYQIQNDQEMPVIVVPGAMVANDVTLEEEQDAFMYAVEIPFFLNFYSSAESLKNSGDGVYVEGNSVENFTTKIDSDLWEIFSCEEVSSLQVSVGVVGLTKELLFDGTDEVEQDEWGNIKTEFVGISSLTEVEIPGAKWDGIWEEPEGTVLFDDGNLRLIDLGLENAKNGNCYFGMILENRTDSTVEVEDVYDSVALLNGEESEYPFCTGTALPGTRTYGYLNLELEGIEEKEDVVSAYCLLELTDESYQTLGQVEYCYGSEEDMMASKEKVEGKKAEEAAREQEEVLAALGFILEEQTIYEKDGFTIKATGAGVNWEGSMKLCLDITNDTETDATIHFSSVDSREWGDDSYIYANGYQISGNAYMEAPAGQTVQEDCFLYINALKDAGIEKIGEFEVQFSIIDEDYNLLAAMEPSVIRTSNYEEMDTELGEDMGLIYSGNGFEVFAKYKEATEEMPAFLVCAIRNNSDSAAGLHIDDLKVNGILDEDFYHWNYELAGKTFLRCYTIREDFLTENDIEAVESLSFSLEVSSSQRGDLTPIFETGDLAVTEGLGL